MNRLIVIGIVALVGLIAVNSTLFTVQQTEQALVLELGEFQRAVREPGLHVKIPFVQSVVKFDNRVLNFDAPPEEVPTSDQKQVAVETYAKFRIVDPLMFYQTMGTEQRAQSWLRSNISASLRETLGAVQMADILTSKRADLLQRITQEVGVKARSIGIEVLDVRMKRVDLPKENSTAILNRMTTQRRQEAAGIRAEGKRDDQKIRAEADKRRTIILAEARRDASILRGEGDAIAADIYNKAFAQDPVFFDFFRSLQAMNESLGTGTTYVGPASGDFFRFFGSPGAGSAPPQQAQ